MTTTVTANARGIIICGENRQFIPYPKQEAKPERFYLNESQRKAYRILMYGFDAIPPEELTKMSVLRKKNISYNFHQAKQIIHIMKARVFYNAETKLLKGLFKHVKLGDDKDYLACDLPKEVTLSSLRISVKEICDEFINRGLLNQNFYENNDNSSK